MCCVDIDCVGIVSGGGEVVLFGNIYVGYNEDQDVNLEETITMSLCS